MILLGDQVVKMRDGSEITLSELGGGGILTPDTEVDVEGEDPTTLEEYVESKISAVAGWVKLWEGRADVSGINIPLSSYSEIGVCSYTYDSPEHIDFKIIPIDVIRDQSTEDIYIDMVTSGEHGTINLEIDPESISITSISIEIPTGQTLKKAYIYAK